MATARDVVYGALKHLAVVAAGETPKAPAVAEGLTLFNEMISGLQLHGVDMQHTALAISDTLPYPDSHLETFKAMLAARMAPSRGRTLPAFVQQLADGGLAMLQAHYAQSDESRVDIALARAHRRAC